MKKFLVFAAAVVLCGTMVFAQRPVQQQKKVANTQLNQQRQGRDNTGVRTTATSTTEYTYTISQMQVPNVTVSDANITVVYQKPDRLKVTLPAVIEKCTYYLYDANNSAISKGDIKGTTVTIDMKNYQPGEYRLQILAEKDSQKNFKVTKR